MVKDLRNPTWTWCIIISLVFGTIWLCASEATAGAGRFEWGLVTTLSERYEDNYDLLEKGFEEEDYITSFTPELTLSYLREATDCRLVYRPSLEFYADNSDEDEVRQNGTFSLDSLLTPRLRLQMRDVLRFTPGSDIAQEDDLISPRRRSRSRASDLLSNDFTLAFDYRPFQPTTIRTEFTYGFDDYDKSEFVDTDEYGASIGIDHQITGRDTLSVIVQYQVLDYDQGTSLRRVYDTDVQNFLVGETHQFSRELLLILLGGVSRIDEDDEDRETDWVAQASLSKGFRTGSVEVAFDRSVSGSSGRGGTTVDNNLRLVVHKDFTRRLSGHLSVFYSTEESSSGDDIDTEDWGMRLRSTYGFSRKLTGSFSCSFTRQNSRGDLEGDTDNYRGRVKLEYDLGRNWSVFTSGSYYQQNALHPTEQDIENSIFEVGTKVTWH